MKKIFKKAIILPLIVIAALSVVIYKVKSKPPVEHQVLAYPTRTVEIIRARTLPFRGRALAYGNVEPAVLLKAKSEVSGKISYIHPLLNKGASLEKGTLVLRIEPTTFEFSLNQSKAGLLGSQSSLKQLEAEEQTTLRSIDIAKQKLQTGEKELERLQSLVQQRLVSHASVDAEEQKVLQLRQQLEDLQGKFESFNSRKTATMAQIDQSRSQLAQSQDTLGRTEIHLPFDARIGTISVEKGEYVGVGSVLFEALGTQAVEINAQLPVQQFYPLVIRPESHAINLDTPAEFRSAFEGLELEVHVKLIGNDRDSVGWQGELLRIGESIDPERDTMSLVVAVNNPYEGIIPGKRPPLLKGMYVSVEFLSPAREMLVIPRKAIHQGRVYIANSDNKLNIRPVTVLYRQGNMVVIDNNTPEGGIKEGEKIIISDVIPVIEGLPLKTILAVKAENQLAIDALDKPL